MPRSRSTSIQSERTRRRSPRAFTSPASWMAPPNSSSFSVSVVLPASGWEMMAKVRRRAISCSSVLMDRTKRASLIDGALEHDGILAPADGLVVAAAQPDLPESQGLVQANGRQIGRSGLEEGFERPGCGRGPQQVLQQPRPQAAAAVGLLDADIQQVSLGGPDTHDTVAGDDAADLDDAAEIVDPQAVAEDSLGPWEGVGGALDAHHGSQIGFLHGTNRHLRQTDSLLSHHRHGGSARSRHRSRAQRPLALELLAREFQVHPGLALLPRAAQQVGGMVGDDQRNALGTEPMHLAAQAADRRVGLEQVLSRDAANREDQQRLEQLELALQVGAAVRRFLGARIAIARRAALEHVGDVHGFAWMPHRAQHGIEQLTGAADERLA